MKNTQILNRFASLEKLPAKIRYKAIKWARKVGARSTVCHKSHDSCLHVFLMEARVMTFVAHCTC